MYIFGCGCLGVSISVDWHACIFAVCIFVACIFVVVFFIVCIFVVCWWVVGVNARLKDAVIYVDRYKVMRTLYKFIFRIIDTYSYMAAYVSAGVCMS